MAPVEPNTVSTSGSRSRDSGGKDFQAAAEREEDIPDEVYTLW